MSAAQPPQPGGGVGVPPEHTAFEQLVSVLMSADNAARAAGEAQFAAAKASSPDGLCAGLLSVLTSSASTDSRAFCAVLLRKVREDHVTREGDLSFLEMARRDERGREREKERERERESKKRRL